MDDLQNTPSDGMLAARLKTVSLKLDVTSKRGLPEYESVKAEVSVWFDVQPGATNDEISEAIGAHRALIGHDLAILIDDGKEILRSGSTSKRIKLFMGLPVVGDTVVEEKVTRLPAPRPMSFAEAGAFTTTQGVKFANLTFGEIDKGIEKLEAALMSDLTTSDREVIMTRRDALYTVYNELRRIGPPVENDTLTSPDPNDGALFREAK